MKRYLRWGAIGVTAFILALCLANFDGVRAAISKYGLPGIYNLTALSLSSDQGAALAIDSSGHVVLSTTTSFVASLASSISPTNVSSTMLSVLTNAWFGSTATSSFNSAGALSLIGTLTFDSQTFDSLTDDATLSNNSGDLQVVDVTCTDCLNATEIEDIYLLNNGDVGTGAYDFGGASDFEIPNGADPTVDAAGECALNTTAASSSVRCYIDSAERALYDTMEKTLIIASSTLSAYAGATASTTIELGFASVHGETWTRLDCITDAGTAEIEFGDGTNWMDYQLVSGTVTSDTSLSNNTFTMLEERFVRVGQTSGFNTLACTATIRINAD